LLFVVREAVQTSLGFSPFEFVLRHNPRGPLKLLKEALLGDDQSDCALRHIYNVHYKLQRAKLINLLETTSIKTAQKARYDQKARKQVFRPGDRVL